MHDFIIANKNINEDNGMEIAFAEIKCRTRTNTAAIEKQIGSSENIWMYVTAGDENFKKYIYRIKERMQLLHQAATLGLNNGVLLIGDSSGKLIRGIWGFFYQLYYFILY